MLVAKNPAGKDTLAWDASEECHCPECGDRLFVKDGAFKITHFSHYPESSCSYGAGEGVRHQMLKARIFESLKGQPGVEFERAVVKGRRAADVILPSEKLVIECQASTIREGDWWARTEDYSKAGYSVLWVWDIKRCELDAWPKEMVLCHRLSYGQLVVINPETDEWYSLHLSWTGAYGHRLRSRFRRPLWKELEEPTVRRIQNEGLSLVVLFGRVVEREGGVTEPPPEVVPREYWEIWYAACRLLEDNVGLTILADPGDTLGDGCENTDDE